MAMMMKGKLGTMKDKGSAHVEKPPPPISCVNSYPDRVHRHINVGFEVFQDFQTRFRPPLLNIFGKIILELFKPISFQFCHNLWVLLVFDPKPQWVRLPQRVMFSKAIAFVDNERVDVEEGFKIVVVVVHECPFSQTFTEESHHGLVFGVALRKQIACM